MTEHFAEPITRAAGHQIRCLNLLKDRCSISHMQEIGVMPMQREQKAANEAKKEYLWQYRKALQKEKEIEEEIYQLRMNKISPSLVQDGLPHGSGGSDLSGYAAKIDELLRDLEKQMNKRIELRLRISREIESMSDETESLILRYKYIQGLSFEEIAVRLGYTYRHTTRLHGKALENFKMSYYVRK